jgi:hypothetical protein
VTLKASGGSFGNLLASDMETVTLDDEETTSLTVTAADYTSLEAVAAGTESLATLSIDAAGVESDLTLDSLADAVALTSLTINADGLNSSATLGMVGDAEGSNLAILDTITVTASNGSTIDFHTAADSEEGDINTQGDVVSLTVTATGENSVVEAGAVFADGDNIGTVNYTASNGGTIDNGGAGAAMPVNYGFDSLTLATSGAASTLEAEQIMDEGAITASPEATITIEADGAGSTIDLEESNFGAVDLDTLTVHVGSLATLSADETDVEVDDDVGVIDIDLDSNSTFEGVLDIEAAGIATELSITMGDESEFAEAGDSIVVDIAGGSDSEVGIKTLTLHLATEADTTVDTTSSDLISINSVSHVEVGDSEGAANSDIDFYQGSVTLTGDNENTVNVSNVLDAAELDTAGTEGVFGSWTITTGEGNDTITGSAGADTITSNDGGDTITAGAGNDDVTAGAGADSVLGGAGNDTLRAGNGADTIGGGAGNDSIDLTESVSAADVVEFSAVAGTSSDSAEVGASSGFIDSGQDTITTFTAGVDTIKITATNVTDFIHGTDTDLGEGDATAEGDDSNSYATNVGLINMDGGTADEFGDAGDILINFASPTTTMTEALFEAALQYDITGTSSADTITTGALADTITGGAGDDTLDGGAGADVYVFSDTNGTDTIAFVAGSDKLNFGSITADGTLAEVAVTNGNEADTWTMEADTDIYVIDTDAYDLDAASSDDEIDDFTGESLADVEAFLSVGITMANEAGDVDYVIINDGSDDDAAYVYKITDAGGDTTLEAAEIELVGIINLSTDDEVDLDDVTGP